jgi:hypothetical protein
MVDSCLWGLHFSPTPDVEKGNRQLPELWFGAEVLCHSSSGTLDGTGPRSILE